MVRLLGLLRILLVVDAIWLLLMEVGGAELVARHFTTWLVVSTCKELICLVSTDPLDSLFGWVNAEATRRLTVRFGPVWSFTLHRRILRVLTLRSLLNILQ